MLIKSWEVDGHWAFDAHEADSLYGFALSKIDAAAGHILEGDLPIRPYLTVSDDPKKSFDGMRYSDYPSVMALDIIDDGLYDMQPPVKVAQLLKAAGTLGQA